MGSAARANWQTIAHESTRHGVDGGLSEEEGAALEARVRETAERVLVDNETCTRTFQYGNAVHWANIALGFAALADGQLTAASEYLVRAGKTPGSPQLNSFGPDRDLARRLLEGGERTAVLTYLTDCSRFWAGREALLERWRRAIERGEPTQLERSYDSDDT